MGVTIEYITQSDLTPETRRAILSAALKPNSQPWLLCEPIHFLDMPGFQEKLFGVSKLNLMPDPAEKAEVEARGQPERNDLEYLLDKLEELSAQFGVDWDVQIEGEPIGSIEDGVCDPAVRSSLQSMADIAGELGEYL